MDDSKNGNIKEIRMALENSLAAWNQLCQEDLGPSADEKRFAEMKSLLNELKEKLEELSH